MSSSQGGHCRFITTTVISGRRTTPANGPNGSTTFCRGCLPESVLPQLPASRCIKDRVRAAKRRPSALRPAFTNKQHLAAPSPLMAGPPDRPRRPNPHRSPLQTVGLRRAADRHHLYQQRRPRACFRVAISKFGRARRRLTGCKTRP